MDAVTIRPLVEHELPQWWEMRLRALKDHPDAFGSDYETARERGYGYLLERTFGPQRGVSQTFVAVDDDGRMLATTGTFGDSGKRAHIAFVWGVYTVPEARNQGLSRRLVATAIAHCRAHPGILQVHIDVNADNAAAIHLYEEAGFVTWGREPRALALPDRFDDELHMVLMLDDGARERR